MDSMIIKCQDCDTKTDSRGFSGWICQDCQSARLQRLFKALEMKGGCSDRYGACLDWDDVVSVADMVERLKSNQEGT